MNRKIVIVDRDSFRERPGGDTVQIGYIYRYLVENGYDVRRISTSELESDDGDLYIMFNLTNLYETYVQYRIIINKEKPYMIFPVYWDLSEIPQIDAPTIKKILPESARIFKQACLFRKHNIKTLKALNIGCMELMNTKFISEKILNDAQFIFPNSIAEKKHLKNKFNIENENKVNVIYNCIDVKRIESVIRSGEDVRSKYDLPDRYICCAGAIGPRKNQLNLVKAVSGTDIKLVIIGSVANGCEKYFSKVREQASENIKFIEHINQEDLYMVLKLSVAHIQPSFIETPGLVSMEAAVCGCNVIVSRIDTVKEYFGDQALYCNPNSTINIKEVLLDVWNKRKSHTELKDMIHEYDYENILSEIEKYIISYEGGY